MKPKTSLKSNHSTQQQDSRLPRRWFLLPLAIALFAAFVALLDWGLHY